MTTFTSPDAKACQVMRRRAGVSARLAAGPDGRHALEIANNSSAAQGVQLTIKTKPNQIYLFAAVYQVDAPTSLRLAISDGDKRLLEDAIKARVGSSGRWLRATPIKNRAATLAVTLPPHSSVRMAQLHAIEVRFLSPGSAPGKALTEEQRERLRGLGYRE